MGGGGQNRKSQTLTSLEIFHKGLVIGQKYCEMEDQKLGPCLARNHDFAKEGELEPKGKKFSKTVLI